MYNWSTDEKRFKAENPKEYRLWRLVQLINYGLDGEKLDREEVKKSWPKIKTKIDRQKRIVFEFFLFNKIIKPPLDSPVIEDPKIRELKNKCPICLAQEVIEKGRQGYTELYP